MLFNSSLFVLFAVLVFPLAWALRGRARNVLLLVASYVFYGAWDARFLLLLAASTIVDFTVAQRLERSENPRARRWLVLVSCVANLGILGFFKYADFFLSSASALAESVGLDPIALRLDVVLPVGISFYTFQTLSYTIDVFRRKAPACDSLLDFALYVAFFPQLVAGPIERATSLLPQLRAPRAITRDDLFSGFWLVTIGFFKKCVVADNLAVIVDQAFGAPEAPSGAMCLLGLYAFAFQIYCDFGGYSDIARGLAKWLGIDIMLNFRFPYLATNPQEFWRRWHISLSTWLRDYLYIPLGGSRGGTASTYRNLIVTMVLGGLWHGASWLFVLWGVFHGVLLAAHRLWAGRSGGRGGGGLLSRLGCWFAMWHLTCLGWLLFRGESVGQALAFLRNIWAWAPGGGDVAEALLYLATFVGLLLSVECFARNRDDPRSVPGWYGGLGPVAVVGMWTCVLLLSAPGDAQFIYFQF